MSETCKTCKEKFNSGIWLLPQFRDEKVLLFCSEKCKGKYLKMKINRIKISYPKYYKKRDVLPTLKVFLLRQKNPLRGVGLPINELYSSIIQTVPWCSS